MSKMEDEGTAETVKSELSIFDPLPYQVSHVKADWIRQEPENQCYGTNTATPITIKFDRSPGFYLDFSDSFIDVCVAIEGLIAKNLQMIKQHLCILQCTVFSKILAFLSTTPTWKVK